MRSLFVLILVLVFCGISISGIEYKDGGSHNIDYLYTGAISVKNSFWDEPTIVSLVTGGDVFHFYAYEDCQINLLDGRVRYYVVSNDESHINISGGRMNIVEIRDSGSVTISNGKIYDRIGIQNYSRALIEGGDIKRLYADGFAQADITSGVIEMVDSHSNSSVRVKGGHITGDIYALGNSTVIVTGGQIDGYIDIRDNASVTIEGLSLMLDGYSVFGTIVNSRDIVNTRHLTGSYLDGGPIDINIQMYPGTSVTFAPEPATLLLLTMGGVMAWRAKNNNKSKSCGKS